MKIIITRDDTKNGFSSCYECALATAMKRALNLDFIHVGTKTIDDGMGKRLGTINPEFHKTDFNELESGDILEFHTTFTPDQP